MLSKYGNLYSKYLEEYKPITYQELIMNGTINDFLELKDKEFDKLKDLSFSILWEYQIYILLLISLIYLVIICLKVQRYVDIKWKI